VGEREKLRTVKQRLVRESSPAAEQDVFVIRALLTICILLHSAGAFSAEPASAPALPAQPRPILSPEAKHQATVELIDRFVAHVSAAPDYPPAAKASVADGWKNHRSDPDPEEFLSAGLAILSEPFKAALAAVDAQENAKADAALRPLLTSPDPYLATNAAVLLARSLVDQDRLEDAQAVLEPLVARRDELIAHSFAETEVDFLLAYCQLSNLQYDKALAGLERFEQDYPDAPDRFRLPAHQMLQELRARRPESLGEVSDLMVYSSRRLASGQPGKPVQIKQERAIELLQKMIKEAEQREDEQKKQASSGGQGQPQPGQPNSPAQQSYLPGGKSEIGKLGRSPVVRPGEEWGKMRPADRERVLQSLRKNFPSRYRQLVEQYYRQLAKEK
jgi:tetratricopeptide (TPR) repeat protein